MPFLPFFKLKAPKMVREFSFTFKMSEKTSKPTVNLIWKHPRSANIESQIDYNCSWEQNNQL
jgi:hypothetical protein